ncbi:hypothetical protein H5410_049329 [Solanum commersonii]|uniref:Uncharacterized protein n=1 Tax=Solanum commersonii TaxID=4109 RepID=A0A9J5WUS6_SOLCO|nr:hypothetical protein H5410_049329 [Solanum commersonii]
MEPVGHPGQNCPFTRKGVSWSPWPKNAHLQGQTASEHVNTPFCQFSCAIVHGILRWSPWPKLHIYKVKQSSEQNFDVIFAKYTWNFIKTLAMESVGHHGQNGPFIRSNELRSSYGASWPQRQKRPNYKVKRYSEQTSVKTLAMEPVGHHGHNSPFTRTNDFVRYSPGDLLETQNSDVIFAKNLHGPLIRS